MGLFSRNKEATDPAVRDVRFDAAPRTARRSRRALGADDDDGPLDPASTDKTRARRRLIGAFALALAAIVFVPMLFDRSQAPAVDDIAVRIPDRDSAFEGRRGVPDATVAPTVAPSASAPSVPAAAPGPTAVAPIETDDPKAAAVDSAAVKALEAARPADKAQDRKPPVEKAADKPTPAPADDPRALAALEGKAPPPAPARAADTGKGFAVQVAAFSDADRAKGLREQLVANGLKAYTEPLSTSQGPRTRVRLGPFANREGADRARAKLKTMKLDGSVVPL